jgi:hypothetical protein
MPRCGASNPSEVKEFAGDALRGKNFERRHNNPTTLLRLYFFAGSLLPFALKAAPNALSGPLPAGF